MSATSMPGLHSRRQEWGILFTLAAVNFTHILDFVIMMPLGPQFIRVFDISPSQFGIIVSAYSLSSSIFGFLGSFFIDRFDRKVALLVLYSGFILGTLFCALAPSYLTLVSARMVAGAFGGTMGALIFAIIGDVIPAERRGAATGIVMAAFSVSSILGIPFGLYLANLYGWHAPFFGLAALSSVVFLVGWVSLPAMKRHMDGGKSGFISLKDKNVLKTFAFTILLTFAGFSVIPYISPYFVSNVGFHEKDLPKMYFLGGSCTLVTSILIGRLCDRFGKSQMFSILALFSLAPILILTNLPRVPLWTSIGVSTMFMIFVSGRFVPAMALIASTVEPKHRGSFMSINSSLQQLGASLASFTGGMIMGKTVNGTLQNYSTVGILAAVSTIGCILIARRMRSVDGV